MTFAKAPVQKKVYRAGIAGCGRIASGFDRDPRRKYVATHAGAYSQLPSVKLVAACDLDSKKLEDFGKLWKVKQLYQDFQKMLEKEELDILSICTWPETHYDLARIAVERGVKALFCEKPITDNLAQADHLVELCKKRGVLLAVNHSRRWDGGHQKIKRFLESGKLGQIRHVNCYYTAGILNTGAHLLDVLRFFLGDAQWVYASPAPVFGEKDPTFSGQIFFENGTLVSLVGLDVNDYLIFEFDFYGTKGRLRLAHSGFEALYWKPGASPYYSGYRELSPAEWKIDLKKKRMMLNAVSDLVTCLKTGKEPQGTGEDGRKALEIICAFHESFRLGQRVELPLKNRNVKV